MHTCFANVLSKAFRLSAASSSAGAVCDFLTPSVRRIANAPGASRSFSQRRSTRPSTFAGISDASIQRVGIKKIPRSSTGPATARHDKAERWTRLLQPYLVAGRHADPSPKSYALRKKDARIAAGYLIDADAEGIDVLGHLGLQLGRWQALVELVRKILEYHPHDIDVPESFDANFNVKWPSQETLENITRNGPIWLKKQDQLAALPHRLDTLTGGWNIQGERMKCIGVIWKSLASMVVASSEGAADSSIIMDHVLQILSHMHHHNVIPDSVYQLGDPLDPQALRQPPTLHILSSSIFRCLSDAAWKARNPKDDTAKVQGVRSMLGYQVPKSVAKVDVPRLGPEIWLEFILWSCLHGRWILQGAQIIERIFVKSGPRRWSLINWRKLLGQWVTDDGLDQQTNWSELTATFEAGTYNHGSEERSAVERRISNEVVAAYIDSLVDGIRLGVGQQGADDRMVVSLIAGMKRILEYDNLGLGATSWSALMLRLIDAYGIMIEKDPKLGLEIALLAPPFGEELNFDNSPVIEKAGEMIPSYSLDPSAIALSVLHRSLRSFVANSDVGGALKTFEYLQRYTDANKQRAVEDFAAKLNPFADAIPPNSGTSPSVAGLQPGLIDFPGFFPLIPAPLLADLLDLATVSRAFDFGRWLLFASEIDGPLIPPALYTDTNLAPAIIRFTSATVDKRLLNQVMEQHAAKSSLRGFSLPPRILIAFLDGQISRRRWESVESIFEFIRDQETMSLSASSFVTLAKELLLMINENDPTVPRVQGIMKAICRHSYGKLQGSLELDVNATLALLCTIDRTLIPFASNLFTKTGPVPLQLRTDAFNTLLEAVVEIRGSAVGMDIVKLWCTESVTQHSTRGEHLSGVVNIMPRRRRSRAIEAVQAVENVDLTAYDLPLSLLGKITLNLATARILLRKALEEPRDRQTGSHRGKKKQEVRNWASRTMMNFGLSRAERMQEVGTETEYAKRHGRAAR